MLRALKDCFGSGPAVTLLTIKDSSRALRRFGLDCRALGGSGWRIVTGLKALTLLKQGHWDLIVLGHLNLAPLVVLSPKELPACLGFIHGLEAWQPLPRLHRWGLKRVHRLLYNSRHTRNRALKANSWMENTGSSICPLGLLPGEEEDGAARLGGSGPQRIGLPRPGSYALIIGRMSRSESYKGHEELIAIWPAVARVRRSFPLVVVGEGDDRPRLEEKARRVGAAVQFFGNVDDATRDGLLAHCRCFCMPSRGEGLGLVYLEAMRARRPVLAGATDAGAEVVIDGVTGRTVNPENPEELLQGILDVSGEQAEPMGRAGRERFEKQFCYERFFERFSQHLGEVLSPRRVAVR
jgi:phosphatidylinositol alpha-1,6-mannosyltransferase